MPLINLIMLTYFKLLNIVKLSERAAAKRRSVAAERLNGLLVNSSLVYSEKINATIKRLR